jgi:hypothetical protein
MLQLPAGLVFINQALGKGYGFVHFRWRQDVEDAIRHCANNPLEIGTSGRPVFAEKARHERLGFRVTDLPSCPRVEWSAQAAQAPRILINKGRTLCLLVMSRTFKTCLLTRPGDLKHEISTEQPATIALYLPSSNTGIRGPDGSRIRTAEVYIEYKWTVGDILIWDNTDQRDVCCRQT